MLGFICFLDVWSGRFPNRTISVNLGYSPKFSRVLLGVFPVRNLDSKKVCFNCPFLVLYFLQVLITSCTLCFIVDSVIIYTFSPGSVRKPNLPGD